MSEKILHLRSSGGLYGAEQVILNLSSELNTLGCTNLIVCFNNIGNPHLELVEAARAANLSAITVECRGSFDRQTVTNIRSLLERHEIDVLHCHDYKARAFGLLAVRGLAVKTVATNHLWTRANPRLWLYETIDGVLFNGFDQVVAVSEPIARECRVFMLRKDRLSCIPNGIDSRRFTPDDRAGERRATRARLGLNHSDVVIGNIARLSIEKDHAGLLRAFKILIGLSKDRPLKLVVAGDGPERPGLLDLARQLGIDQQCLFVGVRTDVPQILNCLDIYVQSSRREGLPIIILEAMAAQVPIVSTKAGGIPNVITDHQHGRLVEIGDPDQLAAVLNDVLTNADERQRSVVQARQLVERQYSGRLMATRYLDIYRQLLGRR